MTRPEYELTKRYAKTEWVEFGPFDFKSWAAGWREELEECGIEVSDKELQDIFKMMKD